MQEGRESLRENLELSFPGLHYAVFDMLEPWMDLLKN
jgi:hypothetical protein